MKPETPVIDLGEPICEGLFLDCNFFTRGMGLIPDLVSNLDPVVTGTPVIALAQFGPVFSSPGGNTDALSYPALASDTGLKKISIECFVKLDATGTACWVVNKGDGASATNTWNLFFGSATVMRFDILFSGGYASWTIPSPAPNTWVHYVITYDGTSTSNVPNWYVNGVKQSVTVRAAASGTISADLLTDPWIVGGQATSGAWVGEISHVRVWNRLLSPQEVQAIWQNPWRIYVMSQKLEVFNFLADNAGNVYNVSISESASAADTVSSLATLVANDTESASAADTVSSQANLVAAISEAGSAADTTSSKVTSADTISEAASAADTVNGGLSFSAAIVEGGSAADTTNAQLAAAGVISEAGSASDTVSSQVNAASAISESASAADTVNGTMTIAAAIVEGASAADTVSSKGTLAGTIAEAAVALDTVSSQGVLVAAIVEVGNAQDTENAPAPGANIIVETMNAQDTVSCVVISNNTVTESASAQDTVAGSLTISANIVEAGSATDVVSAQAMLAAVISEFGAAQDVASAVVFMACQILETADAVDIWTAGGQIIASACNTLSGHYRVRVLQGSGRVRILTGATRVRTLKGPCC